MAIATRKAFIFSIDAFIAFTISLVAIYSLIFFSSVPSAYYATLAQAHTLSRDTLFALSTTKCTFGDSCLNHEGSTVLDTIVFAPNPSGTYDFSKQLVIDFIGPRIPHQYGYRFEVSDGSTWDTVYDTAKGGGDEHHKKNIDRIAVSSHILTFDTAANVFDPDDNIMPPDNPYTYLTCNGRAGSTATLCSLPTNDFSGPEQTSVKLVRLTIYA